MENSKSSARVGIITFRFNRKIYLLQNDSRETIVYKSHRLAIQAISDARRNLIEDGGMAGLFGDILFDFRALDVENDGASWWAATTSEAQDERMEFGKYSGLMLYFKGINTIHDAGTEAKPKFEIKPAKKVTKTPWQARL